MGSNGWGDFPQFNMLMLIFAIYPAPTYTLAQLAPVPPDNDITNTTIFVGGLDPNVTEEELKQIISQFGELIYVKIPTGKECGFVQFSARASAAEAIQRTHGTVIGQQMDQSGARGQQVEPSQWAYYNYGYDPYGYAAAQDPYEYGTYANMGNILNRSPATTPPNTASSSS